MKEMVAIPNKGYLPFDNVHQKRGAADVLD